MTKIYHASDMLELMFHVTGAEPVQFRNDYPQNGHHHYHCDAPQFLPSGGADDGMTVAMVARDPQVWDFDPCAL